MKPGLRFILTVMMISSLFQIALPQSTSRVIAPFELASNKFDLSMYPNPAGNSTTVSIEFGIYETSLDIFILEMNGKIIEEYNYDNVSGSREFTLALDNLINGIYSVAVQTNETYRVERLIVLKWYDWKILWLNKCLFNGVCFVGQRFSFSFYVRQF